MKLFIRNCSDNSIEKLTWTNYSVALNTTAMDYSEYLSEVIRPALIVRLSILNSQILYANAHRTVCLIIPTVILYVPQIYFEGKIQIIFFTTTSAAIK